MDEWSITDLQRMLGEGQINSSELVDFYLGRIDSLDQVSQGTNSIIEINPQAGEIARSLDKERDRGAIRGPLHGIPIVLKDNIDTKDQMMTTAGSLALAGSHPEQDAFLVQRLRQAGALILAKANLSEWANFRGRHSSSGWSSRGGQTRNPYSLDRSPSGSSSGSAVAVAANFCAGAVGTETDGSIVSPAHSNGIVGIKPTLGLISRSGVIPISHSQDSAGPMTRTVKDAAILLGCMAGYDPDDRATHPLQQMPVPDFTRLEKNALQGARLGIARIFFGFNRLVDKLIEESIDLMRKSGAVIIDPVEIIDPARYSKAEIEVLLYDFKHDLNQYLANLGSETQMKSIDDIIEFNQHNEARVMPFFGQERMLAAQSKGSFKSKKYLQSLIRARQKAGAESIDAATQKHNLDAIIAPTGNPAHLIDWINGDHTGGPDTSSPPAVAGYPHITVPAGYVLGLPVGISFMSTAWQEARLIQLAYAFEQASPVRRSPQFLPSVNEPTGK